MGRSDQEFVLHYLKLSCVLAGCIGTQDFDYGLTYEILCNDFLFYYPPQPLSTLNTGLTIFEILHGNHRFPSGQNGMEENNLVAKTCDINISQNWHVSWRVLGQNPPGQNPPAKIPPGQNTPKPKSPRHNFCKELMGFFL